MKRIFPQGFIRAYCARYDDGFIPPIFNKFVALSTVSAALQRKVWLPIHGNFAFFPNIYVLLVADPAVGKSTAISKGTGLLQEINRKNGTVNILPSSMSESAFYDALAEGRGFEDSVSVAGKTLLTKMNSGFYFASEASAVLCNKHNSKLIESLTDFYDCNAHWVDRTQAHGHRELTNICVSLLAGSTFTYLNQLVSDNNVRGGFASRMLYVVHRITEVKEQELQRGGRTPEEARYDDALAADLMQIHKLVGCMYAEPEMAEAWKAWHVDMQTRHLKLPSDNLKSLVSRTNPNVLKLSMLFSAAESDDRCVRLKHFQEAVEIVESINKELPDVFREARAQGGPGAGGKPLANLIMTLVPKMPKSLIRTSALAAGFNAREVDALMQSMIDDGTLAVAGAAAGGTVYLKICGDVNKYL